MKSTVFIVFFTLCCFLVACEQKKPVEENKISTAREEASLERERAAQERRIRRELDNERRKAETALNQLNRVYTVSFNEAKNDYIEQIREKYRERNMAFGQSIQLEITKCNNEIRTLENQIIQKRSEVADYSERMNRSIKDDDNRLDKKITADRSALNARQANQRTFRGRNSPARNAKLAKEWKDLEEQHQKLTGAVALSKKKKLDSIAEKEEELSRLVSRNEQEISALEIKITQLKLRKNSGTDRPDLPEDEELESILLELNPGFKKTKDEYLLRKKELEDEIAELKKKLGK